MNVVGFIGATGTGKSHRAMWVAKEENIEYIIDDGLLIKGNSVIAGASGKKESTKLASVRRAMFLEETHAREVKEAISQEKPSSILVLGTSKKMLEQIVKVLELSPIKRFIRIEDVATHQEIEKARNIRQSEGKHVIPVPTFEIKKDFSGYFLHPLKIFKTKGKYNIPFVADKSVVRPTFSYLGEYTISDNVIFNICQYEASLIEGVAKVGKIDYQTFSTGLIINMEVIMEYGCVLNEVSKEVQYTVKKAIEKYTALNILMINITVRSLFVSPNI